MSMTQGMTQSSALTILKTGANVFITGAAGSGKTHVVNEYIAYLREHHVPVGITASTGIAATHIGGMTIHAWSGIGVKDSLSEDDLDAIMKKGQTRRHLEEAQVLVIDEVSMLHHFRLDLVDQVLRHVRGRMSGNGSDGRHEHLAELPFGGLQVVLCGDFFQLPPVSRYGDPEPRFIYHSHAWKEGQFAVCYLSENFRQVDDIALSILNEIRSGEVTDEAREHLRSRYRHRGREQGQEENRDVPDMHDMHDASVHSDSSKVTDISATPTRLFTHNVSVDAVNDAELGKIPGPECQYEMTSRGRKPLVETLKKNCLAPERLRLRKGARVMCVKNNFEQGYVNGTLGTVVSCGPGVDPVIRTVGRPRQGVAGKNGAEQEGQKTITIEQASWTIEDDGKVLAEIQQYPLRLAWAITVHKSQGMSLDAAEVDLSQSFEPGMGYVALSRVRTLAGLTILGMNEMALQVHPEVLEHDRHLRQLSEISRGMLAAEDDKDIASKHAEFLAKVAPLHRLDKGGNGGRGGRDGSSFHERKISTFEKTADLIRREKSLKEIAKERELTVETIIAHIEYLIGDQTLGPANIAYLKHEISPQYFNKIEKALEEVYDAQMEKINKGGDTDLARHKLPLLSSVKSKLGPNISFKDIRLARVLLGYITTHNITH
jgi:hypothetical protein